MSTIIEDYLGELFKKDITSQILKQSSRGWTQCVTQQGLSGMKGTKGMTISIACAKRNISFLKSSLPKCKQSKNPSNCTQQIKQKIKSKQNYANKLADKIKQKFG